MKTKMTRDLFQIVTLRTPELIESEQKNLGFIFHPSVESNGSLGHFLSSINAEDTIDEARGAVISKLDSTYQSGIDFDSQTEVESVNPALW